MSAKTLFALFFTLLVSPAVWAGLSIQHWTTPQGGDGPNYPNM